MALNNNNLHVLSLLFCVQLFAIISPPSIMPFVIVKPALSGNNDNSIAQDDVILDEMIPQRNTKSINNVGGSTFPILNTSFSTIHDGSNASFTIYPISDSSSSFSTYHAIFPTDVTLTSRSATGATGPSSSTIRRGATGPSPTAPSRLRTTIKNGYNNNNNPGFTINGTATSGGRRGTATAITQLLSTSRCLTSPKVHSVWDQFNSDGSLIQVPSTLSSSPSLLSSLSSTRRQTSTKITAKTTNGRKTSTRGLSTSMGTGMGPTIVDMITIPIIDQADIDSLTSKPTQMGVLSRIVSDNPGLFPGFVQMDMCTYELLEICTPPPGSPFCTPDQCYGQCMALPACRRVTFTPDGLCQMETRKCQKEALISSGNSYLRVSPVYAAFPGNCPNNFLEDETMHDDRRVGCTRCSIAECRTACDMMPDCAGFSFADSSTPIGEKTRQCYIKSDTCTNPVPGTHIYYHKLAIYI